MNEHAAAVAAADTTRDSGRALASTTDDAPVITGISDDTGTAGDRVTSDNTLVITGTANPGATVRIYDGINVIGTAQADANGAWTFDNTGSRLADGTHMFRAQEIDATGNGISEFTDPPFNVIVDATPPAKPQVTGISDDTGRSQTDGVTTDNTLVIRGKATAGLDVEVFVDGQSIGIVRADQNGNWSIDHTGTPLAEGTHNVTAEVISITGLHRSTSDTFQVTIDTIPVAAQNDAYAFLETQLIAGQALNVLANDSGVDAGSRIISATFVNTGGTTTRIGMATYAVSISQDGRSVYLKASGGDGNGGNPNFNETMQIRYVLEDAAGHRSTAIATVTQHDNTSPLILDLDGDGAETLHVDAGVRFDMGSDGDLDRTGWVGRDDGLLALDRNGNGAIDNQSELFGTDTTDGFTILSQLDSNENGRMDAADARFSELKVWQDVNSDGISQAGELKSLAELGIAGIDLDARETSEMNNGNFISHESTFIYTDGRTGEIVDAWFALGQDEKAADVAGGTDAADLNGKGEGNAVPLAAADLLDISSPETLDIEADAADHQVVTEGYFRGGRAALNDTIYHIYMSGSEILHIEQVTTILG